MTREAALARGHWRAKGRRVQERGHLALRMISRQSQGGGGRQSVENQGGRRNGSLGPSAASVPETMSFQDFRAHVLVSPHYSFLGAVFLRASFCIVRQPHYAGSVLLRAFHRGG